MVSQATGLNLYQQEKEYLLKLFLYFYYKRYNDAIFKGGTCLKFLFGLDRFSEDLDFNVNEPLKFRKQVRIILKDISQAGINNYQPVWRVVAKDGSSFQYYMELGQPKIIG